MADMPPPNPSPMPPTGGPVGAVPPKKETGKVQPKKETVRINLPPKPTAAPTIKLPTLPPGGPTGAPSLAAMSPPPASAAPTKVAAAPAPAPKTSVGGPGAAQRPAPVASRQAPLVPTIKPLDKILIYTAVVASLVAVGGVTWIFFTLKNIVENPPS